MLQILLPLLLSMSLGASADVETPLGNKPPFFEEGTPHKASEHLPLGRCWKCEEGESSAPDTSLHNCHNPCCLRGVWLPEAPPLFLPFKADPRQLSASAGWRFNDQVLSKNVIDVSYFDLLPIYRWFNIFTTGGELELDMEGALWAVFHPMDDLSPLVNADYYVGFSLNFAKGPLALRLRGYHISSHIGDEFLLSHPDFDRKNPSAEYIDLFASYQTNPDTRLYLGAGYIVHRDNSVPFKRLYGEGGAEAYLPWGRLMDLCHMVEGKPYFAVHFRLREDNRWDLDQTYALGYEFSKLYGLERKLRFYLEYHDGYSLEGQFCCHKTNYLSLRVGYGF